jgi:hypothetical protein
MEEPTITIPSMGCLANTCLQWGADGDLAPLDLDLILEHLAQVDQDLVAPWPGPSQAQPRPPLS